MDRVPVRAGPGHPGGGLDARALARLAWDRVVITTLIVMVMIAFSAYILGRTVSRVKSGPRLTPGYEPAAIRARREESERLLADYSWWARRQFDPDALPGESVTARALVPLLEGRLRDLGVRVTAPDLTVEQTKAAITDLTERLNRKAASREELTAPRTLLHDEPCACSRCERRRDREREAHSLVLDPRSGSAGDQARYAFGQAAMIARRDRLESVELDLRNVAGYSGMWRVWPDGRRARLP